MVIKKALRVAGLCQSSGLYYCYLDNSSLIILSTKSMSAELVRSGRVSTACKTSSSVLYVRYMLFPYFCLGFVSSYYATLKIMMEFWGAQAANRLPPNE